MNLIIATSISIYLAISLYFGKNWLKFFKASSTKTPENYFLSLIILVIITISWPFVLPLYLITSLSSFILKGLFSTKPKNTYLEESIPAVPLTTTPAYQSEKV
ncbi:hypothetical protein ACE1CI_32595 [Aerosakkonemataceae cyanobacterium BLCC-F50]|uniref:Uncharacterized protein n=1 Tax=Floridaenema flaviceps BLCC-F50 TaxID=3153642 RepID=A0ABV4Y173_9CYAN